jgi:hypothetical protein
MKEKITICKRENGKLVIIKEVRLNTSLDERTMELTCRYEHKQYKVEGNIYMPYIVIE